ncbi:Ras- protein Rab-11A [Cichlidogyrus casuarinus]|uniref:Ras- protein Rab-11A n=1 Tax=Cichlidogyrus casuarinus TaxID=1844966 RepID=A0ABD2QLB3_9PLAT
MNQMEDTQIRTALLVHSYARDPAARQGLNSIQMIDTLVMVLHKSTNQQIQDDVALTLQHLSKIDTAAREIIRNLPIAQLLQMLRHPSDIIVFTAISILHQYIYHFNCEVLDEIRKLHGPHLIAELFDDPLIDEPDLSPEKISSSKSPMPDAKRFFRILTIAADTIRYLAFEHEPTKIILLSTTLNKRIVQLLTTQTRRDKLRFSLARLVKVLSVCPDSKVSLVKAGAVQALGELLFSQHSSLIQEGLWALRNLSDQAIHLTEIRALISRLIQLLQSHEEHIATCSAGCLCNLTCQNPVNKALLVELGGVAPLCQTLVENRTREEITEPVCSALRHITHQNTNKDAAIYQIKQSNCIGTIVNLLSFGNDPSSTVLLPLVKAVLGLVRNLALDKEARKSMRELGGIKNLSVVFLRGRQLLQRQIEELEEGSRLSVTYSTLAGVEATFQQFFIEGVRVDHVVELALASLHSMAKDQKCREEMVHTPGLLTGTVQTLYLRSQDLQRAALGFLSELSVSSRSGEAIEREGAIPKLTELIQSSDEAIAAYSAAILHRASYHKPSDYRKRLNQELRQSLFDNGILDEESLGMVEPLSWRDTLNQYGNLNSQASANPEQMLQSNNNGYLNSAFAKGNNNRMNYVA